MQCLYSHSFISRSSKNIFTPTHNLRQDEVGVNAIRVNRLSQITVSSAAPSAIQLNSKNSRDEVSRKMMESENIDSMKSNFACRYWRVPSVYDEESISSSHSNLFGGSDVKAINIFGRKQSLKHPRLRHIEREERIIENSIKKSKWKCHGKTFIVKYIAKNDEENLIESKNGSEKSIKLNFTGNVRVRF
jgi:hypothetical protein